jgi:hypothetical protein
MNIFASRAAGRNHFATIGQHGQNGYPGLGKVFRRARDGVVSWWIYYGFWMLVAMGTDSIYNAIRLAYAQRGFVSTREQAQLSAAAADATGAAAVWQGRSRPSTCRSHFVDARAAAAGAPPGDVRVIIWR